MLKSGILNPHIKSLISQVRHTNILVIADRGFPFWPALETIDIALMDDVPAVLQVLNGILPNFNVGEVMMADEFKTCNPAETQAEFAAALGSLQASYLPHDELKRKVPQAIGLIGTGDTTPYTNMILVSA